MFGWGWGGNSSSSADNHHSQQQQQQEDHVIDEDPDSDHHADLAVPEVDANGAHYADEAKALQVGRRGVLPSLVHEHWGAWTEDDLTGLQLRGASYLQDRIKIDCGPPLFRLAHIDIFHTLNNQPKLQPIATRDDAWVKVMNLKRRSKAAAAAHPPPPYPMDRNSDPLCHGWSDHPLNPTFVVNIVFPVGKIHMYLVQYYERRVPPADVLRQMKEAKARLDAEASSNSSKKSSSASKASSASASSSSSSSSDPYGSELLSDVDIERVEAFDRLLQQFIDGDDEFRDSTLKIIPRVSEGSWVVKKGVGRVPAILGKKVAQSYYINRNEDGSSVVEIDADLATSRIAGQIVGLIKSYCKTIVVDMSFLLQGDSEETLPESLIGGIRIHKADMDRVQHYDESSKAVKYPDV